MDAEHRDQVLSWLVDGCAHESQYRREHFTCIVPLGQNKHRKLPTEEAKQNTCRYTQEKEEAKQVVSGG